MELQRSGAVAGGPDPRAVEQVRRLVDSGAKPRVAAGVVAELTGVAAKDKASATPKATGTRACGKTESTML